MIRQRPSLVVLTQHYQPEPNFITADVAEMLAADFDVTVVTAHPNYPEGRFYPGVRAWRPERRFENGVTVWRLPMFPYHGRRASGRFCSYLSFALAAALWAPLVAPRPSVAWVYHGPFTVGLASLWYRLAGTRVVFTCADLWPESFLAAQVHGPGFVMRMMYAYSRAINRVAHLLICSTRGTLRRYAADGRPASALCYVPVWIGGIPKEPPPAPQRTGVPRIVYAGNIGPAQKLDTVVRAAALLVQEGVPVRIDMYGTGASVEELRRLAAEVGATNLTFHGRLPPATAFVHAAGAVAQIVCLQPTPLFAMTIPSKLSFSFAAASPVLYGLVGESAVLVKESGGGIAFDPNDPATLVSAIRQVLALSPLELLKLRANLRQYYETHFEQTRLLSRYRELFLTEGV